MTDNHRDDSRLDAAIDRAVRDIMRAEPRAGLRERVMAELAGEPARSAWRPRVGFGLAAVAAAIVILLVIVNRSAERPIDQTVVRAIPPAAAPARTGVPDTPREVPPARVDGPRPRTAIRRAVVEDRPVQAASIDTRESIAIEPIAAVERLGPIDPIRIARLETRAVPGISITPITIEPIEITPLTPPQLPQR